MSAQPRPTSCGARDAPLSYGHQVRSATDRCHSRDGLVDGRVEASRTVARPNRAGAGSVGRARHRHEYRHQSRRRHHHPVHVLVGALLRRRRSSLLGAVGRSRHSVPGPRGRVRPGRAWRHPGDRQQRHPCNRHPARRPVFPPRSPGLRRDVERLGPPDRAHLPLARGSSARLEIRQALVPPGCPLGVGIRAPTQTATQRCRRRSRARRVRQALADRPGSRLLRRGTSSVLRVRSRLRGRWHRLAAPRRHRRRPTGADVPVGDGLGDREHHRQHRLAVRRGRTTMGGGGASCRLVGGPHVATGGGARSSPRRHLVEGTQVGTGGPCRGPVPRRGVRVARVFPRLLPPIRRMVDSMGGDRGS